MEDIHEIDGDSKIIGARKVPIKHSRINWYKNFINPFNHPATAMNVKALRKVGGYRHCYLHEDWFLWLHFLKMGYNVANIGEFLVGFRNPRKDPLNRLIYSKIFKILHDLLFNSKLKDPRCPFPTVGLSAREQNNI